MVSVLSAGTCLLHAQAIIEFGGVARRVGTAAPTANVGKSTGDVIGKVGQSLGGRHQAR